VDWLKGTSALRSLCVTRSESEATCSMSRIESLEPTVRLETSFALDYEGESTRRSEVESGVQA
jgi:hypothetical protein